ncbi:MAG: alanine racemase, partial [Vicinamibacterales bacterium]|nr:alanine racemase [Vicinamibacterales bacterium]
MIRNTVAHVDLGALSANVRAIRDYLAREPRNGAPVPALIAVVKANAYGHGAERVALAIEAAGADTLACADI